MLRQIFILTLAFVVVFSQSPDKLKLKFKVSASGLKGKDKLGQSDPYVKIYYTEGASDKQIKVGQSDTISNTNAPNWGNTFEFDYDKSKLQKLFFKIKDDDTLREDDTVASVWVVVQDYVEKGQSITVNLIKQGTLTIKNADPNAPVTGGAFIPAQPQQHVFVSPAQPAVISPVIPVAQYVAQNQPQRITFKLSARGLPDTDVFGTVDPYVKAFSSEDGKGQEEVFGRTKPLSDQENPDWTETFTFDYVRGKNQKWHLLVLDSDDNRRDDEIGSVFVNVDDFVSQNKDMVINLPKGQLIVKKV